MSDGVIVVGAGVGGLSAAIALASQGRSVTVLEATERLGGLAGPIEAGGVRFDGGPYILLDPTGLGFAFEQLGLSVDALGLRRVDDVYEVEQGALAPVRIFGSLERTVETLERDHPGQGVRYRSFVNEMATVHRALEPLQRSGRPSPWTLIRSGAVRHSPFLLRSLGSLLGRAGFSGPVRDAVGIWTHVAGQSLEGAPSPLALVPAMIHGPGCFVPKNGVAAIVEAVADRARAVGVTLRTNAPVASIALSGSRISGVRLESGEFLEARQVVSNASGVATLTRLLSVETRLSKTAAMLPLQSPGVASYGLAAPAGPGEPYLRFEVDRSRVEAPCRLLVRPGTLGLPTTELQPVRVVAPLAHAVAQRQDEAAQHALLDAILGEPWVQRRAPGFRELTRLVPVSWGRRVRLYRDSMNPVMTAAFMRQGRLPHRVPMPEGLFLVGSSTHPGQWVSFCLISGLLGAAEVARS